MGLQEDLIRTWKVNCAVNHRLLESVDDDALRVTSRHRARSVGDQFAHIHNVRLMWLDVSAPDLAAGLQKVAKDKYESATHLVETLQASDVAMTTFIERCLEAGRVTNYKGSPALFLGYLLAHEGHHRGQILLTLKLDHVVVDQQTQYGIWDWVQFDV